MTYSLLPVSSDNVIELVDNEQVSDINQQHMAVWFNAFVQYTDQKKITGQVFKLLFEQFQKQEWPDNPQILDIGFGEGGLSFEIAQSLIEKYPFLTYNGIEQDEDFLGTTHDKLQQLGVNNIRLMHGNCFNKDLDKLPNDAHLVLASHVGYYTFATRQFVSSLISKVAFNGMAIFLHESLDSDINILRKKYCNYLNMNSNQEITQTLASTNSQFIMVKIRSKLEFPENMNQLWLELKKYSAKIKYKALDNFESAKNLLEFIVQTPLESLHANSQLDSYFKDIQTLFYMQNNILIIRTEMQLAIAETASNEFKEEIFKISKIIEKKLYPSHVVHEVILDNDKLVNKI